RAIRRGVGYLVGTQRDDGTWDEPYYTGTGFPGYGFGARMDFRDQKTRDRIAQGTELQRGFMLNYNLYRHYFPLMALGRARKFLAAWRIAPFARIAPSFTMRRDWVRAWALPGPPQVRPCRLARARPCAAAPARLHAAPPNHGLLAQRLSDARRSAGRLG